VDDEAPRHLTLLHRGKGVVDAFDTDLPGHELFQHLDRKSLTVPVPIPTTDGRCSPMVWRW
jgi:hypothetical protein